MDTYRLKTFSSAQNEDFRWYHNNNKLLNDVQSLIKVSKTCIERQLKGYNYKKLKNMKKG